MYGGCEAVLPKCPEKAQPRCCLLSLQVSRTNFHKGCHTNNGNCKWTSITLCFDFSRKNGNDEQCFRAQNILHPPCAQVSCQHVLAISTKINKKYHFLNLFTPGTPWLIIITTKSYHNLVSSFRLPLVGMAKRQTFRHVTRWQGTAGLKTSIISLAVLLV